MEIEFNANNVNQPDPARNAPRPEPVPRAAADAGFKAEALERKLKELPVVRPEKVAEAKALIADAQYPPDLVLKSLANLLAMKIND